MSAQVKALHDSVSSSAVVEVDPSSRIAAVEAAVSVLHIASIVIHVRPQYVSDIRHWLEGASNNVLHTEIHAESEQGKFVVVIETENEKHILALLDAVLEQPGALNSALVYHEIINEEGLN